MYSSKAFADELEKLALGNIPAAALTFGIPGALLGGYSNYAAARARGEDTPGALLSTGKGALVGGLGAAGLGAGVSALHGGAGKSISDFGRRMVHGVSGFVPKGHTAESYARSIGVDTGAGVESAKKFRDELLAGREPAGMFSPSKFLSKGRRLSMAEKDIAKAETAKGYQDLLMRHGVTSIPGLVRALKGPHKSEVLGALAADQWHGTGLLGKGLMGLGVYSDITRDKDLEGNPIGPGERAGRTIGGLAGMALPSTIPSTVSFLAQPALSAATGTVGKAFDKVRNWVKPPSVRGPTLDFGRPEDSALGFRGYETTMSSSAAGKPYGAGMDQ